MDHQGDLRHMRQVVEPDTIGVMKNIFRAVAARRFVRELASAAALAAAIFSPGAMLAFAQTPNAPAAQGAPQRLPDLVGSLKATPGVLGVDAGQMVSRKQVIFAWFENKQAVLNWFYSDAHQTVMRMYTPGASSGRKPLADIADTSGPILAIASLTMADKAQVAGVQLPISQIAIELYAPLPGGLAVGGRFAPATVKVPGLLDASAAGAPLSRE
jgi:hypothetical protein